METQAMPPGYLGNVTKLDHSSATWKPNRRRSKNTCEVTSSSRDSRRDNRKEPAEVRTISCFKTGHDRMQRFLDVLITSGPIKSLGREVLTSGYDITSLFNQVCIYTSVVLNKRQRCVWTTDIPG